MNETDERTCKKFTTALSIVLLAGLLILRFPYIFLLSYKIIPLSSDLGFNICMDSAYILTALLIFLQRDVLAEHHIGLGALGIFLLAPFLKLLVYLIVRNMAPYSLIEIAASTMLFTALLITRPKVRRRKLKDFLLWLLISILAGVGLGALFAFLLGFHGSRRPVDLKLEIFIGAFFTQLGNAAVFEEPLFRGFLWGFLKMARWKDMWIWLFQAALFMVGHIYYLGSLNISFFLVVPIGGLLLGLAAWRSRSIGASMIMHGLANSLGSILRI